MNAAVVFVRVLDAPVLDVLLRTKDIFEKPKKKKKTRLNEMYYRHGPSVASCVLCLGQKTKSNIS